MTIQDTAAIISTAALVYFCVGTFRIERALTKVEQHLERIRNIASDIANDR